MEVSTISTEEINQQAKRILDFPIFRNSPVLSRFLNFIIAETLHNRESQLKEYSVAIKVLYRSRDFNPNGDSIVRIHAGRLRRALNDYYLTQGIYDPIIIRIPKGCYVPQFVESGVEAAGVTLPVGPEQSNKPIVAIFPFRVTTQAEGTDKFLVLLEEQLCAELVRLQGISVIGYYSMEMKAKIKKNILETGKSAGADYILTGSLTYIGQHIRILINLLATGTGEVLLCKTIDRNILFSDFFELLDEIVKTIIDGMNRYFALFPEKRQKSYL